MRPEDLALKSAMEYAKHLDYPVRKGVEREFFIYNVLVRIHFIIVMIRSTGLAPWEFKFPFPGNLISTFLGKGGRVGGVVC